MQGMSSMLEAEMKQKQSIGWWFISLVNESTLGVIRPNIDAIFDCGPDDVLDCAQKRNPWRPGEMLGLRRATLMEKGKAIRLNKKRTDQILELYEIMQKTVWEPRDIP